MLHQILTFMLNKMLMGVLMTQVLQSWTIKNVPYKVIGKLHVVFPDELHFMHSQTTNEMFLFSC